MGAPFAELIDRAARDAGLNDYQLSAAIGLLPGWRVFSSKQVARLRRGTQRHGAQDPRPEEGETMTPCTGKPDRYGRVEGHDWRVEDPQQEPPRTLVCQNCGRQHPAKIPDPRKARR